jgi:hypothetical protein
MTDTQPKPRRRAIDVAMSIHYRRLADGSRIADVPLPGAQGLRVTLDAADFDRLMDIGMSPAWFTNGGGYVRAEAPASFGVPNLVQVARVIMEPPPGCIVKYRDGDRLNLRRSNLLVVEASRTTAKARERFFGEMAEAA